MKSQIKVKFFHEDGSYRILNCNSTAPLESLMIDFRAVSYKIL